MLLSFWRKNLYLTVDSSLCFLVTLSSSPILAKETESEEGRSDLDEKIYIHLMVHTLKSHYHHWISDDSDFKDPKDI